MAQSKEQRQAAINAARKANHEKMLASKKRVDAYVDPETKDGLKAIKAQFDEVRNEGQAIDKAVELALSVINDEG